MEQQVLAESMSQQMMRVQVSKAANASKNLTNSSGPLSNADGISSTLDTAVKDSSISSSSSSNIGGPGTSSRTHPVVSKKRSRSQVGPKSKAATINRGLIW